MLKISEDKVQGAIAGILRYGSQVSALVMALGLALFLGGRASSKEFGRGIHLAALLDGLRHFDSGAVMQLGILLLLLTPVFRVAVAAVSFALERDHKYFLVSLGVLSVVVGSIAFALEK